MGRFLIKQPNGKYCLFSTTVDCPVMYNLTKEEYINYKVEQAKEYAMEILNEVDNNPKSFNLFENMDKYFAPNNMTEKEYMQIKKEMEK